MKLLEQMTTGRLLLNGQEIGLCQVTMCQPEPVSAPAFSFSGSYSMSFRVASGKKARRLKRSLYELSLGKNHRAYVRHYRKVKHHQLRKRWLSK